MSLPLFLSPTFTLHPHRDLANRTTPTFRGSSRKFTCLDCCWAISRAKLGRISGLGESLFAKARSKRNWIHWGGVNGGYYTGERSNGTRIAYILIRFLHEILWNFSTYVYFSSNYRLISSRVLVSMQIHISGIFAS